MRLTTTLVAMGAAALFGAACGDDDGGSPDARVNPDGNTIDGGDDEGDPDAALPRHKGTVAISEVTVTTPGAPNVRGGAVSIIYTDPAVATGETLVGTDPPISTCLVRKYTPKDPESPPTDEGPITISGDGLLKPLGTCDYAEGAGYECTIDSGSATLSVSNFGGPIYTVAVAEDWSDTDLVGAHIRLSGFTGDAAVYNGTFGIVRQTSVGKGTGTELEVIIPGLAAAGPATKPASHDYRLLGGFGPVVTGGLPFAVDTDFLGDAESTITIEKADLASPGAPALDVTLPPAGEGFAIDAKAVEAHEFPFTAGPVTFTCGESCGSNPATSLGNARGLQVIAISGRTTDAVLPNPPTAQVPPFFMPPVSATVESYATFQCTFFETAPPGSNGYTATMPQAAVEAILSTNPTRIETRIFRFSVSQSGANTLVGHGVVGHSSPPPPAASLR